MSDGTGISWTDATWNVVCTRVSPGCVNCYAVRTAQRFSQHPHAAVANAYAGLVADGDWTGRVNLAQDLTQPLRWSKPRRVFVAAQGDLFHREVPDGFIARLFAVMALSPQHTFQVLTKRPARMRALLSRWGIRDLVMDRFANDDDMLVRRALATGGGQTWPLPNVWLGVSVEDQKAADLRIPILLDTPAAVRWLSCEPLLGRVELRMESGCPDAGRCHHACTGGHCWRVATCEPLTGYRAGEPYAGLWDEEDRRRATGIDWVVVGGESGPNARPMHPDWARSLRDQCTSAGVPFHFKQWGEWAPDARGRKPEPRDPKSLVIHPAGMTALTPDNPFDPWERGHPNWRTVMHRVGKKAAGRLLDGVLHDEYPGGAA